ncbi:TPA: hypothetical protein JBD08_05420 [Legionella pneumophila subsp. pneumophila]|uniref:hypothetical protein n=1 Tax=Legionella pneumophila TaxID=446 RepID=UPI0001527F3F|nr:hypothetical protein [Legionella pneumophila]ABQ57133.1 hypothetical protein LPC_3246 [Legionella pneumophila str. Corby]ADG26359.1 hypothetical protein lpa_04298 [Legionella pneumophila 2300/99 Alcoy]HAT8683244.1 hypothetical protein [Legionella pneumophila subsp. pneumophila ATCC 43283]HAT8849771.1 hypothetical protein [Legionella pneumophila subsp. pneumophila]MCZ4686190.1 hypothetical protein [Legionella pneumophila]
MLDDDKLKIIPTETILKDALFQEITIQEYQDLLEERGLSRSVLEFLNLKGKSADKEKLKSHLDMHQS